MAIVRQSEALSAFNVEVSQKYVTDDAITGLAGRIGAMISSVREELWTNWPELVDAVVDGATAAH